MTSGISEFPCTVGSTIGVVWMQILVALGNLFASFVLGFVLSWRIAIFGFTVIAVCVAFGYLNFTWLERFEEFVSREGEDRTDYINESVNSIRTIAALTREAETMRRFRGAVPRSSAKHRALIIGAVRYGVTEGAILLFAALVFWWGGRLLSQDRVVSSLPVKFGSRRQA